jgi:lipid A 3-O-deacylase
VDGGGEDVVDARVVTGARFDREFDIERIGVPGRQFADRRNTEQSEIGLYRLADITQHNDIVLGPNRPGSGCGHDIVPYMFLFETSAPMAAWQDRPTRSRRMQRREKHAMDTGANGMAHLGKDGYVWQDGCLELHGAGVFMRKLMGAFAALAVLAGFSGAAHAQVAPDNAAFSAGSIVSDIRGGIYAHDMYPVWLPFDVSAYHFDQIEDVNLEVLLRLPDTDVVRWMGSPKVAIGGTLNLDGQESMAHLGLTWQVPVFDTPIFVEATAGAAIHNGILTGPYNGSGSLRPQGCRVQFYTGAGVGLNITDSVYALVSYEHMSNADLCSPNYGLSNMGVRLGVKFN